MFKLIKILNSGINTPETEKLPVTEGRAYTAGEALLYTDGKAVSAGTDKPTYICAETKSAGEGAVRAYAITSDMLFECPLTVAASDLTKGNLLALSTDSEGRTVGVGAKDDTGAAILYDHNGASNIGDAVVIKF